MSVAEETGLKLAMSENPEDRFCHVEAPVTYLFIASVSFLLVDNRVCVRFLAASTEDSIWDTEV